MFAADSLTGTWDAAVQANGAEVPFRMEVRQRGANVQITLFNGDERVSSTSGGLKGDALLVEWSYYAANLKATIAADGSMEGVYKRSKYQPYPFRAKRYQAPPPPPGQVPSIAGSWNIITADSKEPAWRFLVRQSGLEVAASVLRVDGDTGTLSGSYRGDGKFVLSHFSGARPAIYEITAKPDGTLKVVQNTKREMVAVRSNEAKSKGMPEPVDPSRWTSVKDPSEPLHFSGKDLQGKLITDADPRFKGKVVVLNIGGSWCPNCHDEAPFLEEMYRKYHQRGLEVVTLSFEEPDQLESLARLKAFIKTYGVTYTMLVPGEPDQLHEKLPQAVNLTTWPATFFLGRDGRVRGSHAGFAGKATGELHEHLKAEFTATLERLLAEAR